MNGAGAIEDRPIGLRIRQPSMRLSRYIEDRIDARFQEVRPDTIAAAQDEGIVYIYVPRNFDGDWEHFVGVVTHLYLNNSPEFSAAKAKDLADEATKPDAPLLDISYAWEAIGKPALAVIQERGFMSSENPDLAYAAARAAAFLGDPSAPQALIKIARTNGHRFQINAIQVLGALPSSPAINETLRPLLDSPENLVRIEAYKMLAKNNDNSIFSTEIRGGFKLDIVKSSAAPVLYATRRGEPRVAVIGDRAKLMMPITFTTLDKHLSISSDPTNHSVTIYYRPVAPPTGIQSRETLNQMNPIRVKSGPDIAEVIARLGGEGDDTGRGLRFNYGQIVAILNNLTDQQQVSAVANGGGKQPASFILQELPQAADSIYAAPVIPDQGRPQGEDEPGKVGMAK